jgi:hypothetical protein
VYEYANFDPGMYIVGIKDCRIWAHDAVIYAKK